MVRHLFLALALTLVCGHSAALLAGEADELRQKAKAVLKAAEAAAREGRPDEAERLEREARELKNLAEQHQHRSEAERGEQAEREVAELKERLEALLDKERKVKASGGDKQDLAAIREQREDTERALKKLRGTLDRGPGKSKPGNRPGSDLEHAERKAHHLRVAAENLKHAEEHDLAHKLFAQSEQILDKIRRERHEREQQHQARETVHQQGQADAKQVAELRNELERLRAELRELREQKARQD